MEQELYIPAKAEQYQELLPKLTALIEGEPNLVANLANFSAVLKEAFNFWWVGFYVVDGDQLVLGPFQGPVACTRIAFGKGVCGTAWKLNKTLVVADVNNFKGHIACSAATKSEIVVPIINADGEVALILDIDSNQLNYFDTSDKHYLEQIAQLITAHY